MNNGFNIRVYGLCIAQGKLLVNEELIRGKTITKFPGGGLNWGEGAIECLKREWMEELNAEITKFEHFYTTDFFQASAYDNSQVISIYYLVQTTLPDVITNTEANERSYWMDLNDVNEHIFTLPIDKVVGRLLQQRRQAR